MIKLILTNVFNKEIEFSSTSIYHAYNTIDSLSTNSVRVDEKRSTVGAYDIGANVESKDITIEGDFKENASARQNLIDTVLPASPCFLRYIDDSTGLDVYLEGRIIDSPDISNTKNKQMFQFVFHAPYPYWKKSKSTIDNFYRFEPLFEFPITFYKDKPFMVSEFITKQLICTINKSSNDVGYTLLVETKGPVNGFALTNVVTQEKIKMKDSFIINSDDKFLVTIGDDKTSFTLNGKNVFKDVDKRITTFFKLHPGDNVLQYEVYSGGINTVKASISYRQELVGI